MSSANQVENTNMVIEEDDHDESDSPAGIPFPTTETNEVNQVDEKATEAETADASAAAPDADASNAEVSLEDFIKNEKKSLSERIQKAKAKVKVEEGKNFNQRVDINFEDEELTLRPEVLHVYGVDFLSTQDICKYFQSFGPVKIEWLNDSSCNAVFPSEALAESASLDLALTVQDPNLSDEWKKGIPYKERNVEFSLYFRLATTKDVKGATVSGKESKYYKYMNQKMAAQRAQRRDSRNDRNNYNNNSNRSYQNSRNDSRYGRNDNSRYDRSDRNRRDRRYDSSPRRGRHDDSRNDRKNAVKRDGSEERREKQEVKPKQQKKKNDRAWSSSDSEERTDRRGRARARGRDSRSNSSNGDRSRSRSNGKSTDNQPTEVKAQQESNNREEKEGGEDNDGL